MFSNSISKLGFLKTVLLSKLVDLRLSNSVSSSLNTDDKARFFLSISCKLSTYDLVVIFIIVFGDVKVGISFIKSCSSNFNPSSGSHSKNDVSSTLREIPSST